MATMSSVVGDQYGHYKRQYELLTQDQENVAGAMQQGQDAALAGVELAKLQTAFGLAAK